MVSTYGRFAGGTGKGERMRSVVLGLGMLCASRHSMLSAQDATITKRVNEATPTRNAGFATSIGDKGNKKRPARRRRQQVVG